MMAIRIIDWIIRIAGLGALALGLLLWFTDIDLTSLHILFGVTVALTLLILSIMTVSASRMRVLGAVGIVYALILPVFGLTQERILDTGAHWIIQTIHLLVGIGALALAGVISTRYKRLKLAAARSAAAL